MKSSASAVTTLVTDGTTSTQCGLPQPLRSTSRSRAYVKVCEAFHGTQVHLVLSTPATTGQNWQTSQGFKSKHTGGANFVMCDGATKFLSDNIDYRIYQRLGDRRDGEVVGEF